MNSARTARSVILLDIGVRCIWSSEDRKVKVVGWERWEALCGI